MTPLGWFAIGCLATEALVAIAYFVIFRRRSTSQVDRSLLVDSERTRLREEVEAEKLAREKMKVAKERLEADLRELMELRKKALEKLDERMGKKIRDYVDDPDLLLGEIDRILVGSSSEGSE